MIDLESIKERTDLLALAGQYTHLARVSGAEYAGPCPRCGGTDRFHVNGEAGWWFCRQCHDKRGDAIEFVRWVDGLPFREACERLGAMPSVAGAATHRQSPYQAPAPAQDERPPAAWQTAAVAFVAMAQGLLWGKRRTPWPTCGGARPVRYNDQGRRPGLLPKTDRRPATAGGAKTCVDSAGLGHPMQGGARTVLRQGCGAWTPTCSATPKRPSTCTSLDQSRAALLYGLADLAGHSDAFYARGEFDALFASPTRRRHGGSGGHGIGLEHQPRRGRDRGPGAGRSRMGCLDTDEQGRRGSALARTIGAGAPSGAAGARRDRHVGGRP